MRFTLGTNVYIDAFRDPAVRAALAQFEAANAPRLVLTSVAAHELLSGARTAKDRAAVRRHVIDPLERRGRLVAPDFAGWAQAGDVRAALATTGRASSTPSFVNDIFLAVSCRQHGLVLVTRNARDFEVIQREVRGFHFAAPYP